MSVGEGWCDWFYTPVVSYKIHALTVYLQSTYGLHALTVYLQSICSPSYSLPTVHLRWSFFAETVNVLRSLAIFAEELHRVSLTRCLTGF